MNEKFKQFVWTSKFCVVLGLVGCFSGLFFQRMAGNGTELWCLGLCFLGAAYIERRGI